MGKSVLSVSLSRVCEVQDQWIIRHEKESSGQEVGRVRKVARTVLSPGSFMGRTLTTFAQLVQQEIASWWRDRRGLRVHHLVMWLDLH